MDKTYLEPSTSPNYSSPVVVTSNAADKDLNTIKNQHAGVITGMTNQATTVAQSKATSDAIAQAKAQTDAQAQTEQAKIAIDQQNANTKAQALAVPAYGSDVTDASGNVIGQAKYDPNTGKLLKVPKTTTTKEPISEIDQANADRIKADEDYQKQAKQVQNTIDQIRMGSIPLTPGEQAQVDGLKQQFGALIEQQKLANIGASGLGNVRGYQTGSGEYDPSFQTKVIGSIVTAGLNKVADLNTKMASAVATLTTAFQDRKISMIKDAWNVYKEAAKEREDTIAETIKQSQDKIKEANDKIAEAQKQNDDILLDLAKNNAPSEVLRAVNEAPTLTDKIEAAGDYLQTGTGIVGEYSFYKRQAQAMGQTPVDFNTYQNMDANRKIKIASAGSAGTGSGLNAKQLQYFNSTTTKFQADPFINTALKGLTAIQIADQVLADPNNATNQLKSLYVLVKNLDPDSAVREGEISLADKTQSYLQRFQTSLARVSEGRVISPDAAVQLAEATKDLAEAWTGTAEKRVKQYQSQAKGLGISDAFSEYLSASDIGGGGTGNSLIQSEAEAEKKVQELYESKGDAIDKLIEQEPNISYSEILQVLGY